MARIIDFKSRDSRTEAQASEAEQAEQVGDSSEPWLELVNAEEQSKSRRDARTRGRDLTEFAIGLALVLIALWIPKPWQLFMAVAAILWACGCILISEDDRDTLGLRTAGFLHSLWVVFAALMAGAAAILISRNMHTFHPPDFRGLLYNSYGTYIVWAFLQELLLLDFFLLRLMRLMPSRQSALFTATLLFAGTHLPNPVLTPLTLVWGCLSSMIFLRYRNIFTPAIAHAILGICIAMTIPDALDHGMHVGLGYFSFPH